MNTNTFTEKTVEKQVRRYCREDVSLIENYEQAKADNFKGWCIHHRLEYIPCQNRWVSRQELKDRGIYYRRPSWELIFMKRCDHNRLHRQDPKSKHDIKKAQESSHKSEKWLTSLRSSEKFKAAARQNIKKATEASHKSEKFKQNLKKAQEAAAEACRKPIEIDGVIFESQRCAAKHFGVSRATIGRWLNGKGKTSHVCRFLPKEGLDGTCETSHM